MSSYLNGRIPYDIVSVVLATGTDQFGPWEIRMTPGMAARWSQAKANAVRRFGRTIYVRPGWNAYRPIAAQRAYYDYYLRRGQPYAAAKPGTSTHGGPNTLAIDVDPNGLTWDQVWQACREAGFLVGAIMSEHGYPDEPWHIIDTDPNRAVPSGGGEVPLPIPTPKPDEEEEDDMGDYSVLVRTSDVNGPSGTSNGDWTLGHRLIGQGLAQFVGNGEPVDGVAVVRDVFDDGKGGVIREYRGFFVTNLPEVGTAWSRAYAKGIGGETARVVRNDYIEIQKQLSLVAIGTNVDR